MPVSYIDIPSGVSHSAKEKMSREVFDAIHEVWPIPDTRILIRDWPAESVSQDGHIEDSPMRPICFLDLPPGLAVEAKHTLVQRISTAIAEACGREQEDVLGDSTRNRSSGVRLNPANTYLLHLL